MTNNKPLPLLWSPCSRDGQAAGRGGPAEKGAGQLRPVLLRGAGGPQVQLRPGGEEKPAPGGAAPRPGGQVQVGREPRQVAGRPTQATEDLTLSGR